MKRKWTCALILLIPFFNRRLLVPETSVAGVIEVAREKGTNVRRKAGEMIDNRFAEDLEKSGFLKELWSAEIGR